MAQRIKPKNKLKFNPIEGEFQLISDNNFSYESIPTEKVLCINENNQMIVMDEFEIEENATLNLEGSLILEP